MNEREKQLAIKMWKQIKQHIGEPHFHIYDFKFRFCEKHNLDWFNYCWFCTVYKDCTVCPLRSCGKDDQGVASPYTRACILHEKDACDEIIEAIRSVEV